MVYFLNEIEQKYLTLNLRPVIRQNPVPEELRGWNWHSPPLKPYYDVKLPMYLICGDYCSTGRDVYLSMVEKIKGEEHFKMHLGKAVHNAIAEAIKAARSLNFDASPVKYDSESLNIAVKAAWDYTISSCKSAYLKARAEQPYASDEDIVSTSIPFLVEHRMDGSLLGCSGIIAVDCYDYMRNIVFDVKVSNTPNSRMRLHTTGYALIIESLYEIPVDIGCIVSVSFRNYRMNISKDLHYIDANLRSWWIEERDKKAEIVFNEMDPGKADDCSKNCIFRSYCL
jgi:CRISPR-associated protein Csa1